VLEIFLIVVYTALLSYLIYRWRLFSLMGINKKLIVLAFVIKVISGCALGLLYTHHYTDRLKADTFKFFDDSGVMMDALAANPVHFFELFTGTGLDDPQLEPYFYQMNTWMTEDFYITSNRMMIRINTLFRFLTPPGEYYYLHVIMLNFLSLMGLIFLCKTFFKKLEHNHKLFFALVILFPSLLFWGSGLLKDGVILFALGSMCYAFSRMLNGYPYKVVSIFVFLISALLLALIKIYILFAILPAICGWLWCSLSPGKTKLKFAFVHLVFFSLIIIAHISSQHFDPVHYLDNKQKEFFHVVEVEKPNHVVSIKPINNSIVTIMEQSIPAFFRTLLRPHVFESREPLILMSAAENLFLLLFMAIVIVTAKKGTWSSSPLFYFSMTFFVLIFILIGLLVPITGAMVRYKIVAVPFLLYILFRLLDNSRLEKFLLRFKQ
jgi:hypothetical protein